MEDIKVELKKFASWLEKRAWQEMDKDFEDFVDEYMGDVVVSSSEVIHDVVGRSEQFVCRCCKTELNNPISKRAGFCDSWCVERYVACNE